MNLNNTFVSVANIKRGDIRASARLISMIEQEDEARIPLLKELSSSTNAHIIGITGPPGAGKSTLTDKLIGAFRKRQQKVAVLAVDPSSPFTGGAILGDRIRMQNHATDDGVYIRSLATRGHLGGLSRAASESARVLGYSGYDTVIIETVGVGQSEVDIVRIADTILLVSVPGLGDDIQAIKAGVMEIGDIFVVNKADKDGAERVVREIRNMLETAVMNGASTRFGALYAAKSLNQNLDTKQAINSKSSSQGAFHHIAAQLTDHPNLEIPPVIKTVAETGNGIEALVDEIEKHKDMLIETGFLISRREANLAWELGKAAADRIIDKLEQKDKQQSIGNMAKAVLEGSVDYYEAVDKLEASLVK